MRKLMKSMLLHACSGGGKCAVWEVVQRCMNSPYKQDMSGLIEFVEEYPHFWPADFRDAILALRKDYIADPAKKLASDRWLQDRLSWQLSEQTRAQQLRDLEAYHLKHGVPVEHYDLVYSYRPEPLRPN